MARGTGTYSRMVAWLKVLLPLIALAVLGTVFLINTDDGFEAGFTFSKADIETLETGSFIANPQINGVTNKGEPFHLVAARIMPGEGDNNLVIIENLNGEFRFASGEWVKFIAESAVMDIQAQTIVFETGGQIETSDGNIAKVETLFVRLETASLRGTGIIANGPFGHISADRYRLDTREGENRVLWFENNVKMQYDLQNESD